MFNFFQNNAIDKPQKMIEMIKNPTRFYLYVPLKKPEQMLEENSLCEHLENAMLRASVFQRDTYLKVVLTTKASRTYGLESSHDNKIGGVYEFIIPEKYRADFKEKLILINWDCCALIKVDRKNEKQYQEIMAILDWKNCAGYHIIWGCYGNKLNFDYGYSETKFYANPKFHPEETQAVFPLSFAPCRIL